MDGAQNRATILDHAIRRIEDTNTAREIKSRAVLVCLRSFRTESCYFRLSGRLLSGFGRAIVLTVPLPPPPQKN